METFKPCPGFPLYAVSNLGRIKRLAVSNGTGKGHPIEPKERFLTPRNAEVCLRKNGRGYFVPLARLLLEAFVGPPPSATHKARHLDDDRTNNALTNLEWGTQKENVADAIRNGRLKPRFPTVEERKKLSEAHRGRNHSIATREKMSKTGFERMAARRAAGIVQQKPDKLSTKERIWITDGFTAKYIHASQPVPDGWRRGRR